MNTWLVPLLLATLGLGSAAAAPRLTLVRGEEAPPDGKQARSPSELEALRREVDADGRDRAKRLALVQGLIASDKLTEALVAAKAWREVDAYNLVVVRLLGDIYSELHDTVNAQRTYSAVVELLPEDAQAQRALSTVLKQEGNLGAAYDRLVAAARLAPDDQRIAFELADVAHRLGRAEEAERRFLAIVSSPANQMIAYPAKQRLAQLYARRRGADQAKRTSKNAVDDKIRALGIQGGVENDIKVYLTWDTDKSDIDLWVTNPAGRKIWFQQKQGAAGEALYDDVTTGYGPESFTAEHATRGTYVVQVDYYGTNRASFVEARGEVVVILNEGTAREEKHVLPYRLFQPKQVVTVAKIEVK